ncbi:MULTISPECIES: hypothetical protein [Planococcus]|uniref:Uncharacterized protein n=1 Tax=Planococcus faecalis TaxID=1598147 RepID=A0ABM6IW59_9BACL|nr:MULTISPECIES: hypothetical protein [Planococcus]AQU80746.1 hypothetical protein AJGP001_16260 [Planococcus faecalis]MDJ0331962.1 hypothetical protein [Planococcus sp. S3-L1]OHX55737.1 hypothetical protein BB777_00835 [Planococcus faecalis]
MNHPKLVFVGYFILFPVLFLFSSLLWRFVIRNGELLVVATDALAILAIYYFIVSAFLVTRMNRSSS